MPLWCRAMGRGLALAASIYQPVSAGPRCFTDACTACVSVSEEVLKMGRTKASTVKDIKQSLQMMFVMVLWCMQNYMQEAIFIFQYVHFVIITSIKKSNKSCLLLLTKI